MRITPTLALLVAWGAALNMCSPIAAQSLEHQVKAAFLVNFAKFVEWPPERMPVARAPLVIGVMGAGEVAAALRALVSQGPVRGCQLEVREPRAPAQFDGQILYLGPGARREDAALAAGRAGLLVVGEQATWPGLMLAFFLKDRTVGFRAWPARATACGLTMSSRLLQVAQVEGKQR